MDWKKVAINVLRSLNQYLNVSELSDDVQIEIVMLYEKLSEDERLPQVIKDIAEMLDLDVSDIVAVLTARMLAILEAFINDEDYIDVEPTVVEPEVVMPEPKIITEDTERFDY